MGQDEQGKGSVQGIDLSVIGLDDGFLGQGAKGERKLMEKPKSICPVCKNSQASISNTVGGEDSFTIQCPRCGKYKVTGSARQLMVNAQYPDRQRANISGWLSENQGFFIHINDWERLANLPTPSFHEKADKLLLKLEKLTSYAGENIEYKRLEISAGWCQNDMEMDEILDYLSDVERVDRKIIGQIKIAPNGWQHLETLKKTNINSVQGFVAMSFSVEMKEAYEKAIEDGILKAGYKPHRVDRKEHNNKIDDEIIAQIRQSRFVLADFTEQRGGVYFEAGFAKGLNLEVFWTCRKDDIENLHFDTRQYNHIEWEADKLDEFRERITNRIAARLGKGSYKEAE